MSQRDIERLRALEKDIRDSVNESNATHTHLRANGWADRLATLIAELGQEVGADEPVSFAVELADGTLGALGWIDYAKFEQFKNMGRLAKGARYVFAYRESPAHTSEARDAARYQFLAGRAHQDKSYDIFGNGGHWSIGVHSNDNRLDLGQAIDAAMRQEGE